MIGITEEDKNIVLDSILIDLLIGMLERDKLAVAQSKIKIKEPYIELIDRVVSQALKERKELTAKKRKLGIKIYELKDVNEDFVEYPYIVRGYESNLRMFRYAIKNYMREKLNRYFNEISHQ